MFDDCRKHEHGTIGRGGSVIGGEVIVPPNMAFDVALAM